VNIEDHVAGLFARANPVPSLDLLDPIETVDIDALRNESERSSSMSGVQTIEPQVAPRRQRVAGLVAAAALVVIAIGVVIALANQPPEVAASPVQVAEAFMEARNAHDAEAMAGLLADDVVHDPGGELVWSPNNLSEAAHFEQITAWVYDFTCVEGGPTQARCAYTQETNLGNALGIVSRPGAFFLIEVDEGQIVSVTNRENGHYPVGEVLVGFSEWLVQNHPEDVDVMLEDVSQILRPESLALWEQYVPEFVAEMEASG
jgi:hypothetical protein